MFISPLVHCFADIRLSPYLLNAGKTLHASLCHLMAACCWPLMKVCSDCYAWPWSSMLTSPLVPCIDGYALVVNLKRHIILHRFNFKGKVRAATFSPDSELLAVAIDRNVQVWRSPGLTRTITPFSHVRTFTGHFDNVTNVAWSANSK